MYVLYDSRTVHPLDRYEYVQAGAATELAPVAIRGRAPGDVLGVMSVARIGEFVIESAIWAADAEIAAHRTDRLIRAGDPGCYRIYLSVNGGVRMEQAGIRTPFRARDIGLYDVSRPWRTTHSTGPVPMRVIMLTFPRRLVPLHRATLTPLVGTVMPRNLPGRDLIARFLIGLTDPASSAGAASTAEAASTAGEAADTGLADLLRECAVGLIRQRLGLPNGITARTRQALYLACVRGIIRSRLGDPDLGPAQIAKAANISPRYLHKLFEDSGLTPMQLLKRLRLEACHRTLRNPALVGTPLKDIIAAYGYRRPDQFARDFKQFFGSSATQVRELAGGWPSGREGEPWIA